MHYSSACGAFDLYGFRAINIILKIFNQNITGCMHNLPLVVFVVTSYIHKQHPCTSEQPTDNLLLHRGTAQRVAMCLIFSRFLWACISKKYLREHYQILRLRKNIYYRNFPQYYYCNTTFWKKLSTVYIHNTWSATSGCGHIGSLDRSSKVGSQKCNVG